MALRMTTPMPHGTPSGARFAVALEKDNSQRMASLLAPAKKGAALCSRSRERPFAQSVLRLMPGQGKRREEEATQPSNVTTQVATLAATFIALAAEPCSAVSICEARRVF